MKRKDYDRVGLISERFSTAAKEETRREGVQMISEDFAPRLEPVELYPKMREYVDILCKAKCGQVPEKKSDCKGVSEGHHTCKVRLISNNASFHFERGCGNLLKQDFNRPISIRNQSINGISADVCEIERPLLVSSCRR